MAGRERLTKMTTNANILVVRRELAGAGGLEEGLGKLGHAVCATVSCGKQAIKEAADKGPDLAFVDLALEREMNGIETGGHIGNHFDIPVIYLVDDAPENLLQLAQESHPYGYVPLPVEERQLRCSYAIATFGRMFSSVSTGDRYGTPPTRS